MKCPYRKIIKHYPDGFKQVAYDEERFAECYEKECPYYFNGLCSRVLKEVQNDY